MTQLEFLQNFTIALGAGEDDIAATEGLQAYNATGQTALAAIITYTKSEAFPAVFKCITDILPRISNALRITKHPVNLTAEASSGEHTTSTRFCNLTPSL